MQYVVLNKEILDAMEKHIYCISYDKECKYCPHYSTEDEVCNFDK